MKWLSKEAETVLFYINPQINVSEIESGYLQTRDGIV